MSVPEKIENNFTFLSESKKRKAPALILFTYLFKLVGLLSIVCLTGLLFIYMHDYMTQSSYFTTKEIRVVGNKYLSKKDIIGCGNVRIGMNLFSINTFILEKKLNNHPWIKSVIIDRTLPGRLNITVTEQKEVACVDLGKKYLIDKNGDPFKRFDLKENLKIPVIKGLTKENVLSGAKGIYGSVVDLFKTLKVEMIESFGIEVITADSDAGLQLQSSKLGKINICLSDFEQKFTRAKKIITFMEQKAIKISAMDLCNLNRIVVKQELPTVK